MKRARASSRTLVYTRKTLIWRLPIGFIQQPDMQYSILMHCTTWPNTLAWISWSHLQRFLLLLGWISFMDLETQKCIPAWGMSEVFHKPIKWMNATDLKIAYLVLFIRLSRLLFESNFLYRLI